ncbi:MAG TPA: UDP-N-acetylmuramoyl-tripeptide--D-alanyl-D-alanine ligase [Pseudogracilibacillus sp.]|nr:UDP-N-acetylmuramoyl-tripeptide--D-alanyl-D-alanine ligase [Pseudogracilibacillus sp.]
MFNVKWLMEIFPESKVELESHDIEIKTVNTDSRNLLTNSLFVPLEGENFNGHDYVTQAIENGAIAVIWNKEKPIDKIPKEISIFLVDNTLEALQMLAQAYRNLINPKVIGITGSNGKTTTKDLLHAALNKQFITKATEGNYNNHIGLPLTILSMSVKTEILILEMGMSNFGEIALLSKIAKPDIAIITNIGESHIEHLGSRAGISQAKLEIIKYMDDQGVLIVDGDEPLLEKIDFKGKLVKCGYTNGNEYIISNVSLSEKGTTFNINNEPYQIPLLGNHNAQNTSFVIAATEMLNVSHQRVQDGLSQVRVTNMRFELIKGKNDVSLINDAYNASPSSMKASIEVVNNLKGYHEKILVLGDILELGVNIEKYYIDIAKKIIDTDIKCVYTYGDTSSLLSDYLNNHSDISAKHFSEKKLLVNTLENKALKDNLIFFKASRGIKLENIIDEIK